ASQIVRKVECRNIALTLAGKDGAATGFIRASTQRSVVKANYGFHVVRRVERLLQGPCGRTNIKWLALWWRRPGIIQISMRLRVCRLPTRIVIKGTLRPNKLNTRGQCDQLSCSRPPVIEITLRIFRIVNQGAE